MQPSLAHISIWLLCVCIENYKLCLVLLKVYLHNNFLLITICKLQPDGVHYLNANFIVNKHLKFPCSVCFEHKRQKENENVRVHKWIYLTNFENTKYYTDLTHNVFGLCKMDISYLLFIFIFIFTFTTFFCKSRNNIYPSG